MTVAQDAFSLSQPRFTSSEIRIGYDRPRLKSALILNILGVIIWALLAIRPSSADATVMAIIALFAFLFIMKVIRILLPMAKIQPPKGSRHFACAISYVFLIAVGFFLVWSVSKPLPEFISKDFADWAFRCYWIALLVEAAYRALWYLRRYRLGADYAVVTLNHRGMVIAQQPELIPWDYIVSAKIIYMPLIPMLHEGIDIHVLGHSGSPTRPFWWWQLPHDKGVIRIHFTMIDNPQLLVAEMSRHLGNRFEY